MLTRILEVCIEFVAYLTVSVFGDTDAAWLSNAFEPRSDVHTVTKYVAILDDDVANVYTDAQFNPIVLRYRCIALSHATLDLNGTAGGVHGTCELNQHAITRPLDDAAAMLCNLWFQELAPMSVQP